MSIQSASVTGSPTAAALGPAPAEGDERPVRARLSSWALGLSLLALLGATAAMAYVGLTVVPMESASGYYLTDTPAWYQASVLVAFGSLLLWTSAGIAAVVSGIVALVRGRGAVRAAVAIGVATIAPVLTVPVLLGAMTLGSGEL